MSLSANPRITVKGKITDRKDPDRPRREILIEKTESRKLPIKDYPVTHKINPEGLEVIVISSQGERCQASFHRFTKASRFGEGAYIGSATKRLEDRSQSNQFRNFLQQVGVFTPGTQVNLDFEKRGEVIRVYL
jgi:hypothetical protein